MELKQELQQIQEEPLFRCPNPECKSQHFTIDHAVRTLYDVRVGADGSIYEDEIDGTEWEEDDGMSCDDCGFKGVVSHFSVDAFPVPVRVSGNVPYAEDDTWLAAINGKARHFEKTLDEAIAFALKDKSGQCDLTITQALEFAQRFPMRDNQGDPVDLKREILDCGCHHVNGHSFDALDDDSETCICGVTLAQADTRPCPIEQHICFTTVVGEDRLEDESLEEFITDGWDCYQIWKND